MKGVTLRLDIALGITEGDNEGRPMPAPVRDFLMNLLQTNYLEDRQDMMMRDINDALFGSETPTSDENIKKIVQDECPNECASSQDIDDAIATLCTSDTSGGDRFLKEMDPKGAKTMSLRGEYLRNTSESGSNVSPSSESEGRARARKLGFSDETIDQIKAKLENIAAVPGMEEAKEALNDRAKSFFSEPEILDPIRQILQEKMEDPDGGAVEIAKRLVHGTIDTETGKINPGKMRELSSRLNQMKDGEIDIFSLPFDNGGAPSHQRRNLLDIVSRLHTSTQLGVY